MKGSSVSKGYYRATLLEMSDYVYQDHTGIVCYRTLVERYFPAIPSAIPAATGSLLEFVLIALTKQAQRPTKPIR